MSSSVIPSSLGLLGSAVALISWAYEVYLARLDAQRRRVARDLRGYSPEARRQGFVR